jgi:putative selenate reductase molybdopterin-binding subunit
MKLGGQAIGWEGRAQKKQEGPVRCGFGMACMMQGSGIPGIDMGAATIKMNEDGSFNLMAGATDIGTGSDTMLAQIAAETLSVPVDHILVYSSDTDLTPFDTGAYASSTTFISGGAVKKAAEQVRAQILEVAAGMLQVPAECLRCRSGRVHAPSGNSVSYEQICNRALYQHQQHQIMASASHMSYDSPPPFGAQFAEVEVDVETGHLRVVRLVSAIDCGQVINPQMAEGQVEGAVTQAIGYATSENMPFDDQGRMLALSFRDYNIYSAVDMPDLKTILVSTHEPSGPYGAKAVAEIPTAGPAPAIANAVFAATGIRIRDLPITAEKIFKALQRKTRLSSASAACGCSAGS